jgi:hypothetical protein
MIMAVVGAEEFGKIRVSIIRESCMGYIPGYDSDIFISYSHADNEPLIEDAPGWVDFFVDLLRKRIRLRLRGDIQIFRDPQLRFYEKFSAQLAKRLEKSAILICIPSPNYVGSDWCLWELEEFYKRAGDGRIIKVVKTHIDDQDFKHNAKDLMKKIEQVLDSRFYSRNENTGLIEDLMPEINRDHLSSCIMKIEIIAQNLVELFRKLSKAESKEASSSDENQAPPNDGTMAGAEVTPQITVYLAEPTKGLESEYNRIKSELMQFNYRILPDSPLPLDAEQLKETVDRSLRESSLFVHLIGEKYGVRPDGDDRSIPHIQYDLAAGIDQNRQIVWVKPDQSPENANQEEFLSQIKNHSPHYLQIKLEDLKETIRERLKTANTNGLEDDEDEAPVSICLYYHEEDIGSIKPLYNHLMFDELFNVKLPLKDATSLQAHKQMLQSSDAVLLYYGASGEDWFMNIWKQIRRFLSTERPKPLLARAIYAGDPPRIEKDLLDTEDPVIIRNYGQFSPKVIAPFIERIRNLKGGSQ